MGGFFDDAVAVFKTNANVEAVGGRAASSPSTLSPLATYKLRRPSSFASRRAGRRWRLQWRR
ncbi:hypothetical protein KFK09_024263 [Dendrobium nobile]|uniref:Uncharacterized protein n=1 Tax=Dendrobium nobile TaxID=94219 RepID=A0A8T3AED0_DENNO|nr:hypothetical protein KFK09_024263 [Dendrobium nobile]